jgi:hypothetical protein
MKTCPHCDRHVRLHEADCPHCQRDLRGPVRKVLNVLGAGATAVVLAACYGPPPGGWDSDDSGVDADLDGFMVSDGDCDDADATVNPDAAEVCDDGVDNDCDELIDADDTEDCSES